jgi:hypothetical protein
MLAVGGMLAALLCYLAGLRVFGTGHAAGKQCVLKSQAHIKWF